MKILKKIISLFSSKGKKDSSQRQKKSDKTSYKKSHKKNYNNTRALNDKGGRAHKHNSKNTSALPKKPRLEPLKIEPREIPVPYTQEQLNADLPEFAKLGLDCKVLSAIKDMGYKTPTPIQESAIPVILQGSDIIGTAQTGTGKTAAFALPVVNLMGEHKDGNPRVLVLSPTRELAAQSVEAFENFSKYTDLRTLLIQGGTSIDRQTRALMAGMDIVVATPGRLLDHIRQRNLSLKEVKWLILDEVDRMFDMGFIEDVSNIIRYCSKERQTLFFSATMPDAVMRLSKWALVEPQEIGVGIVHSPADTIEHFIYPVDAIQKYDLLLKLLENLTYERIIVFTRTRIDADRIAEWLEGHNYSISTLHSDRSQKERDRALLDFKTQKTSILVATDIASRGLDISGVGCVINYNVPEHAEDYVHRIGRTGRANTEGVAITLYSSDESSFLKKIETFINAKIERRKLAGFDYRTEPQIEEPVRRPRKRNK